MNPVEDRPAEARPGASEGFPPAASVRRVHLVAIGGVGMTALAGMLHERGYRVSGSDGELYPPASTLLERLGIPVRKGFAAENLEPPPDLVVIGNAVSRSNPEVQAVLERRLPYTSMAEAIRRLFLAGKRPVVVAGTHGKTTSTALLAWVLEQAGRAPSALLGGEAIDFGTNFRLGSGELFVVEGDEYDTAFFDKEPKFLHYEPQALLLTAIEFDHADIYRDLDHVTEAFEKLLALLPPDSPIVASADFPRVKRALDRAGRSAERFGLSSEADWRAIEVHDTGGRTRFAVSVRGRLEAEVSTVLMGDINVRNVLGVYALARKLGLEPREIVPGVASFRGVRRRQEVLREEPLVVIDDFAHHPTAIAGTLEAVRRRYPDRTLWAVFEPRSNTSRRRVFQHEFPRALAAADRILLSEVFHKDTDRLAPEERLSVDRVVAELRQLGRSARAFASPEEILAELERQVRPGEVVVFMSNGAFGGIPRRFAAAVASGRPSRNF
jgi:UDP-N-acetylmuramate: L-alanyl-gamma-D-glutamyl-meso-diaminopimelate ligase